jgi:rhodanese-related sulfurtransferase
MANVAMPAGAGSTGEPAAAATTARRDVILPAAEVQLLLGQPGMKLIDTRPGKDFAKGHLPGGLPPEKWSSLRYGFEPSGGRENGEEATYGGGDRRQAAAG